MPNFTGHKAQPDHTVQLLKLDLNLSRHGNPHEPILSLKVNDKLALEGDHQVRQKLKGLGMQLADPQYFRGVAGELEVLDDDLGDGLVLVFVQKNVQLFGQSLLEELAVLPFAIG